MFKTILRVKIRLGVVEIGTWDNVMITWNDVVCLSPNFHATFQLKYFKGSFEAIMKDYGNIATFEIKRLW